jgi:hypothetical protein
MTGKSRGFSKILGLRKGANLIEVDIDPFDQCLPRDKKVV